MIPNDEPFQEKGLDAQLDALAHSANQAPNTPTSRAYRHLSQFYAPEATREAQAVERVRQRLMVRAAAPASASASSRASSQPESTRISASSPARALPVQAIQQPQGRRRLSRLSAFIGGVAAVLVVFALVVGFAVVFHVGFNPPESTAYHWRIIPSPNTTLAVNALAGVTLHSSADGWSWGSANSSPSAENSNPIPMPLVEHWDGTHWRIVATPAIPFGGSITDLVSLAPDNAWAVGSQLIIPTGSQNTTGGPLIEHWDGHRWSFVSSNVGLNLDDSGLAKIAALSPDNIWAVGHDSGPNQAGLIEHWDGRQWSVVAHPTPAVGAEFTDVAALGANDIWVVGSSYDRPTKAVFEHWDGTHWRIVPSPATDGSSHLYGVTAISANDVWVAGVIGPTIPFPHWVQPLFEHWDGQRWSVVSNPALTATIADIVALGPDDVWAVGTMGVGPDVAQQGQGLVEHWDGRQWSLIANPNPHPFTALTGVARDPSTPGKVWVVGVTGPTAAPDQPTNTATLIETTQ